mmetsp:Transcript_54766/g.146213  ORF Transcript_54766/g.146213 Transcript_54766/m.146213 type:complete len:605 (-) Transcript_54766:184-1998(-)
MFWSLTLCLSLVSADLPNHCMQLDVAGEWTFRLGPAQPIEGRLPACGHRIPNNVEGMLAINRSAVVPPDQVQVLNVTLTEDIISVPQRHLLAIDGSGMGMWTMVFDTGLEVRVAGKSLTAAFFFEPMQGATFHNGDSWRDIAKFLGRANTTHGPGDTYASHCDLTSTGWWHQQTAAGLEGGCLWASKWNVDPPSSSVSSLVRVRENSDTHFSSLTEVHAQQHGKNTFEAGAVLEAAGVRRGALAKEVFVLPKTQTAPPKQTVSLRGVARHSAKAPPSEGKLPENFDWRDELKGMVPPDQDPLGNQSSQGSCGSCYGFAGTMMLQMRFRAQLYRQHKILYPLELSYKSPVRCSPYTEGCEGGFSYWISRLAMELGVPDADCDKNVLAESLDEACDWSCYQDNSTLFYASDYWNVGGFSMGSSEESIMQEIYDNGPVELGFSTKSMPEFVKLSGMSNSDDTKTMTIIYNDAAAQEPFSRNTEIHRWWASSHAILAVGWGVEHTSWGTVKYWVVRNSWGRDWGENGYARMRRGNNDAGCETDSSMVMPAMDRLPAGFLEKARKYHDLHATDRATWLAKGPDHSVRAGQRGLSEYCKDRPESADCQTR